MILPQIYQLLLQLSGLVVQPVFLNRMELLYDDSQEDVIVPEIRLEGLLISSKKWVISSVRIPRRKPNEDDFDFFVRVQAWKLELKLPQRCVFKKPSARRARGAISTVHQVSATPRTDSPALLASQAYVDFSSPMAISALALYVDDLTSTYVVEEFLSQDNTGFSGIVDNRVVELSFEIPFTSI